MRKTDNPNFALLLDWIEGRLSEEEATRVQARLQGDAQLQADLAWIEHFTDARQRVTLATPPPRVRAVLNERFAAFAEDRRQPGLIERLVGLLTFDSRAQMATAGFRSAATQGLERQLVYSTEMAEIALNFQPDAQGEQVRLAGQIFTSMDLSGPLLIQLIQQDAEVAHATADELGEFTLPSVPVGEYELLLSSDEFEVLLEAVPLTSS